MSDEMKCQKDKKRWNKKLAKKLFLECGKKNSFKIGGKRKGQVEIENRKWN